MSVRLEKYGAQPPIELLRQVQAAPLSPRVESWTAASGPLGLLDSLAREVALVCRSLTTKDSTIARSSSGRPGGLRSQGRWECRGMNCPAA